MSFLSRLFGKKNCESKGWPDTPASANPYNKFRYSLKYDMPQLMEDQYVANMRIGRSWMLPRLVEMGFTEFDGRKVFDIFKFEEQLRATYNCSARGRKEVWYLMKRNYRVIAQTDGRALRARWWTPAVALEMMRWDMALAGRARRHFDRKECREVVDSYDSWSVTPQGVSKAVDEYMLHRLRWRAPLHPLPLPDAFRDAFEGDGAYSSMMTMVKILGIRLKDEDGKEMTLDECIDLIDRKAEELNGHQLLEFCVKRFFEQGLLEFPD